MTDAAIEIFKKAEKQDGGHCLACQKKMTQYGVELREWKTAEAAAAEMVEQSQDQNDVAIAHYQFGIVLMDEGLDKHKDEPFNRAHDELSKALAGEAEIPQAILAARQDLARLTQYADAQARDQEFVKVT